MERRGGIGRIRCYIVASFNGRKFRFQKRKGEGKDKNLSFLVRDQYLIWFIKAEIIKKN